MRHRIITPNGTTRIAHRVGSHGADHRIFVGGHPVGDCQDLPSSTHPAVRWSCSSGWEGSCPTVYRSNSRHLFMRRHKRSEEHTSELQSLMRISYAVFCLKKKKKLNSSP